MLEEIFEQFPQLETERLILRQIKLENDNDLYEFFSDDEVLKYYDIEPLTEIEQARNLISILEKRFNNKKGIRWGISLKGEEKIIGTCGYHNWAKDYYRGEIGYELSKEYWRKGIMREALNEIILFGFEKMGLNRIEALVEPENIASNELLANIGFAEEGLLREYVFNKSRFTDLLMFSILKNDYK